MTENLVINLRVTPTGVLKIKKQIFLLSAEVAIQGDSGIKMNIWEGDGIEHSEKKSLHEQVSKLPRCSCLNLQT